MTVSPLVAQLRRSAGGEVRDDPATRELYACDASIYRRLPLAALRARDADDLEAALEACREHGVPLTMRGAGTSLAGQAVGRGLVVDCSALDAVEIDPDARLARVGPGVVLDDLNRAAGAHGLAFGAGRGHREPGHARRHDRQQLGRRAVGAPRPDGGPRPGARRHPRRRHPRRPAPGRGGPCARSRASATWRTPPGRPTWCGASRATRSRPSAGTCRTGRACSAAPRGRSRSRAAPS